MTVFTIKWHSANTIEYSTNLDQTIRKTHMHLFQ